MKRIRCLYQLFLTWTFIQKLPIAMILLLRSNYFINLSRWIISAATSSGLFYLTYSYLLINIVAETSLPFDMHMQVFCILLAPCPYSNLCHSLGYRGSKNQRSHRCPMTMLRPPNASFSLLINLLNRGVFYHKVFSSYIFKAVGLVKFSFL